MADGNFTEPTHGATVQSLTQIYNECQELWDRSEQREETRSLFHRTILPMQNICVINRAVCLGLGSFCQQNRIEDGDGGYINTDEGLVGVPYPRGMVTMTQFIAFEYWLQLLRTRADIPQTAVVFQDPAFNQVDIDFLASRGFSNVLVTGGEAEKSITVETFLFAPVGGYLEILEECIETAHPCLMISHSLERKTHVLDMNFQKKFIGPLKKWAPSVPGRESEIERRRIVRPFQRTHIGRPAWRFTDAMPTGWYSLPKWRQDFYRTPKRKKDERTDQEKRYADGLADRQKLDLPPALQWCSEHWIYWRPDNKSRLWLLEKIGDMDEMPHCTCFDCMKRLPYTEMRLSQERTPSPITPPEIPPVDGPAFDQQYAAAVAANNEDTSDSSLTTLGSTPTTPDSPSFRKFSRTYQQPSQSPASPTAFRTGDSRGAANLGSTSTNPDSPSWRRFVPRDEDGNEPGPDDAVSPRTAVGTQSAAGAAGLLSPPSSRPMRRAPQPPGPNSHIRNRRIPNYQTPYYSPLQEYTYIHQPILDLEDLHPDGFPSINDDGGGRSGFRGFLARLNITPVMVVVGVLGFIWMFWNGYSDLQCALAVGGWVFVAQWWEGRGWE